MIGTVIQLEDFNYEKKPNEVIVLAGGCFDIIHSAHIEFLKKAKQLGHKLIVILESDESIRKKKGNSRPINKQTNRAHILANLGTVDIVIPIPYFSSDEMYTEVVKKIKPDIIAVTQNDPIKQTKEDQAKLISGKVVEVMERKKNYSTTDIIKELLL